MKHIKMESDGGSAKSKKFTPTAPPLPPPLPPPPFWLAKKVTVSVTNEQIAKYWRQKRTDEEDHLLAAIKAAARVRARNLTEDDYKRFVESLDEDTESCKEKHDSVKNSSKDVESNEEIRVGIKDWWTKSKYAYLNQPPIQTMDTTKRRATSTYIPNFWCYHPAPTPSTTWSFGIF